MKRRPDKIKSTHAPAGPISVTDIKEVRLFKVYGLKTGLLIGGILGAGAAVTAGVLAAQTVNGLNDVASEGN